MIHRDVPTHEEQLALLSDPELLQEREVWRQDALPLPGLRMRGRRRTVIEEEKTLALSMPAAELQMATVIELSEVLAGKQPLFDQFTLHHQVKPTQRSIDNYVNGGSNRKDADGKSLGPKPLTEFPLEERKNVIKSRQRQYMYLSNNLQRETFDDRNIARSRRYSIMATQYFIRNDVPLDDDAAKMAADAIVDFGHTLNDKRNQSILDESHNFDLGFQIIRIGTLANDDFKILIDNQELLKLVQREQRAREKFWGNIYDATKVYFPKTRLINANREAGNAFQAELERLASICPPVLANLPSEPVIGEYETRKAA